MEYIKKLAQLAALELTPEEEALFQKEVPEIMEAFRVIQNYQTSHSMGTSVEKSEPLVSRSDSVEVWEGRERALANVPEKSGKLVKVPPVV